MYVANSLGRTSSQSASADKLSVMSLTRSSLTLSVVALQALPGQRAASEIHEDGSEGLQVVTPGRGPELRVAEALKTRPPPSHMSWAVLRTYTPFSVPAPRRQISSPTNRRRCVS
jgi:hypothetical protein